MPQKGLDLNFTVMGQLFSNIFDWLCYNVYTAFFIKYALMLCTNVPNFKKHELAENSTILIWQLFIAKIV